MLSRTKILQEVMKMRFEYTYDKYKKRKLTMEEAAGLLGCSVRTFRRKRCRYEENGYAGLVDYRTGKAPANKISKDTTDKVLKLYRHTYYDFTAKHFYEQLVKKHNYTHSYNFTRLTLQQHGLIAKCFKRDEHRKKRQRKSMVGMMLHQDGSTHEWIIGLRDKVDLIVTMDDATSEIYSAFFVEEEGTASTFMALKEVITTKGLFSSLYVDRGSHYAYTPKAGGKVDKSSPTQVGRACAQLGIQLIHAYSPEARGRSERLFGSWQNRLPQELRINNINTIEGANCYLKDVFIADYNSKFSVKPLEDESTFVPYVGRDLDEILCIQEERTVAKDNTVSYKNKTLQIPANQYRYHYIKCQVMVHEYTNGNLSIFHGPRKIATFAVNDNFFTKATSEKSMNTELLKTTSNEVKYG